MNPTNINRNNLIELLAPAGDANVFKAVVDAGADAVYFGGASFGARAYVTNFSIEEAAECIRYAHLRGARAFLTVNTLLKNTEIERQLYDYLKAYAEAGIDAFIIQDLGVLNMIRAEFPQVDIHASTQLSTTTEYGASLLASMGAKRIVTAREIGLKEIAAIRDNNPALEIESFIHGALCYSYSGQCLMSSMIGGRSGNRGRCAGTCRLNYKPLDMNGKPLKCDGEYPLSLKDFNTIESLPKMIKAGVNSFKIEGRMKSKEYAAGVTYIYRKYLDKYIADGEGAYKVDESDKRALLALGNRSGFTDAYLNKHNDRMMISFMTPAHSSEIGKGFSLDIPVRKKQIDMFFYAGLDQKSTLTVSLHDSPDISISCESEQLITAAKDKAASVDDVKKPLLQLGNTAFECKDIDVQLEDGLFIPASLLKNLRRTAIELLEEKVIAGIKRENTVFEEYRHDNRAASISTLNKYLITVQTKTQLDEVLKSAAFMAEEISVAASLNVYEKYLSEHVSNADIDNSIGLYLDPIIRNDTPAYIDAIKKLVADADTSPAFIIACSMDELGLLEQLGYDRNRIILDSRIYTMSDETAEFFSENGYSINTAPYELSLKELKHRDLSMTFVPVYGRIPVMVTANCIINSTKGCNKSCEAYKLRDRLGNDFIGKAFCDNCHNVLYNCKVYEAISMLDDIRLLGALGLRIDFVFENSEETADIINAVLGKLDIHMINPDTTRGHLKRGIE